MSKVPSRRIQAYVAEAVATAPVPVRGPAAATIKHSTLLSRHALPTYIEQSLASSMTRALFNSIQGVLNVGLSSVDC